MAASADDLAWYPGHCLVETALFQRDASTGHISYTQKVCKRGAPLIRNDARVVLNTDRLDAVSEPIPRGALQLIRFVGLAPGGPDGEEQEQDRRVLKTVFEACRFPINHVQFTLESDRVELGRYLTGDATEIENKDFVFYTKGSRFLAIWRFEQEDWSIRMVMVNFAPPSFAFCVQFITILHQAITPMRQCFGHPMFPMLIITEFLRLDALAGYQIDSIELREIENEVTVKSAHRISTMQTLRDLGRLSNRDRYILYALQRALEMGRKVNTRYYTDTAGATTESVALHFLLHADQLFAQLDLDLAFLDNIIASVSHQQEAISSITNMTDSSSMKTIAVLTLLFLPSTYMATIFAMPVFPTQESDDFWIYWAVSIPLTLTVTLVWLGWWYWHKIQRYYDDPDQSPFTDLKTWWTHPGSGNQAKAEKRRSHAQVRRKLRGDTYKEWISSFNEAARESVEKRKGMSGKNGTVNGYYQTV